MQLMIFQKQNNFYFKLQIPYFCNDFKSLKKFLFICFLCWAKVLTFNCLFAQSKPVEILNSDMLEFVKNNGKSVRKLIGNVQIKHDSTLMFCDSAYQYETENRIEAFSNVKIIYSNQATITSDKLDYDGNTKIAIVSSRVVLTDDKTVLKAPSLIYHRNGNYGYYDNGGVLTDAKNKLTSKKGYYYTDHDEARFIEKVVLVNPEYTLRSDTLSYMTKTEMAVFQSDTYVNTPDSAKMFTKKGYYKTKERQIHLQNKAWYQDSTYRMEAQEIFYDDTTDNGWATCDIHLWNKDTTLQVFGDQSIFHKKTKEAWLWENPYAIHFMKEDTFTLFSDTMYVVNDSLAKNRKFIAFPSSIVHSRQMQSLSDSLVFDLQDSTLTFFKKPIVWSEVNQLTGDTIKVWLKNQEPDSIHVSGAGFMVSKEDSVGFNQIKGLEISGKFKNNDLFYLWVIGNSESIYFAKDGPEYIGMNQSVSQEIEVFLLENKPQRIRFHQKPENVLIPMKDVMGSPVKLDGFRWLENIQPKGYWIKKETIK